MTDNIQTEYIPPNNQEAEVAVLGSALIDPESINRTREVLNPKSFYREIHRWIYQAMLDLDDKRTPIDIVTVSDQLRRMQQLEDIGGEAYLIGLINVVPTSINDVQYAKIVQETGERRKMIRSASHILNLAHDETEDFATIVDQAMEEALTFGKSFYKATTRPVYEPTKEVMNLVDERSQAGGGITGIPTGFTDFDRLVGGLQPSELSIIAARPGMGKSSLQSSIAMLSSMKFEAKVAVFSLEMSDHQWVSRILAGMTRIQSESLKRGQLRDDQWPIFYDACGKLSECKLWIDDTPMLTPTQLRAKVRRLYQEHGLDLVIVDYLQLMETTQSFRNRVQQVGHISKSLKAIAKELNIHVNASSQLSRAVEQRQEKRPQLSDLRDSGNIEEDADLVAFIYRDEYYYPDTSERPNIAEINVAKNRNGYTGVIDLYWNGPLTRFNNLQRQSISL